MLRGSIRLFRIRGIQLSVHFTFLLFLAYAAWAGWHDGGGIAAAGASVLTVLIFFTCVVLHELGHAFTARRFGIVVPRIVLLPIGGVAEFSSLPRRPAHEILIAVAGPAVNFVIIGLLAFFTPVPSWTELRNLDLNDLQLILLMNLAMGCFNLLPAFPMDGGRVFRAILAQHLPYVQATRWAAGIGKIVAGVGIGLALILPSTPHYITAVLFGFIIVAGELEYRAVLRQERYEQQWDRWVDPCSPPPVR